ncbi:MAG: hypothetical protein IKC74_06175 [Clostridia bacterium]|nr:hypothetical protein [Clostridia bacterium]
MNIPQLEEKYADLIKSIKIKRAIVYVVTIVATLLVIFLTMPMKIEFMGEVITDREGFNPALIALFALLCVFVGAVAYGIVSAPLVMTLEQECDPEKELILNLKLNKRKEAYMTLVADYFYVGDYDNSMGCAMKMVGSPKDRIRIIGFFNKARCEFFTGRKESLKMTASHFDELLKGSDKLKLKHRPLYEKLQGCIELMVSISENDGERAVILSKSVVPWKNTAAITGFVNYLKGMSACIIGDRDEAVFRFRSVKEDCGKTVLASLSERNLQLLC